MRTILGLILFTVVLILGLCLGWERVAKECDDKGSFENHGAVYSCHKTPAPTGEKE